MYTTVHDQTVVSLLQESARRVERAWMEFSRGFRNTCPPELIEAIEYSLLAPGKRLRPALVQQSFIACKGEKFTDGNSSADACALAVELIHTFSLVHDDLPAMDNDDLRRGRPTSHKVFGEALAILAGDAMTCLAFEVLARLAEPDLVASLVLELASASGPCGMVGGQVQDIRSEGRKLTLEELQHMHRMKTGALLRCACRMGAISARTDATRLGRLTDFGQHLGLAFQIIDDLLDETATPEQIGKATGKDQHRGKNTYPSLLGLEQARTQAQEQHQKALQALSEFGASAEGLRTLASFIIQRAV